MLFFWKKKSKKTIVADSDIVTQKQMVLPSGDTLYITRVEWSDSLPKTPLS